MWSKVNVVKSERGQKGNAIESSRCTSSFEVYAAMDLAARNQTLNLIIHSVGAGNIEAVIEQIKDIEDPAAWYRSQQAVLEQLLETHNNVDNTIEKFYLWMEEDSAYKSWEIARKFVEKHAAARQIVKANRIQRNKHLEASAELAKRWGDGIIPALT